MAQEPVLYKEKELPVIEIGDVVTITSGPNDGISGLVREIDKSSGTAGKQRNSEFWSLGLEVAGISGLLTTKAVNAVIKIKGRKQKVASESQPTSENPQNLQQNPGLVYKSYHTEPPIYSTLAIEKMQLEIRNSLNMQLIMSGLALLLERVSPEDRKSQEIAYELNRRSEILSK